MDSTLIMASSSPSSFLHHNLTSKLYQPVFNFKHPSSRPLNSRNFTIIKASSDCSSSSNSSSNPSNPNPLISSLKTSTAAIVFAAAVFGKFHQLPARASPPAPPPTLEKQEEILEEEAHKGRFEEDQENSPLTQFLESNSEAVEALKSLLQEKIEVGEDEEGLKILRKLSSAQLENTEWKFLMARLLNEMGKTQESREVFEEILARNPLSFEALFENALLMDRCGEGAAVLRRLEEALKIAEEEKKVKEARDVRFIMAQVQFLQKNVEEALQSYEELEKEDPTDFRPYFCKGMIYSLLDRNKEAREQFAKYRELSPKKFEVEGYLRTPLSRMKLFGTDENEN
ncbi:protein SLOW GREEN 1, chloroplastic-like [Coffea eugenioides]|uniref:protein SLOW GREEN 1, chloroplastic-like n=1 Tax=Coffea eugenioides TaxID=49369 RepID=UPI000F611CF1|nr:protein SLOW GREEN 1, chloroplastic-like [Coffea eugenioides]